MIGLGRIVYALCSIFTFGVIQTTTELTAGHVPIPMRLQWAVPILCTVLISMAFLLYDYAQEMEEIHHRRELEHERDSWKVMALRGAVQATEATTLQHTAIPAADLPSEEVMP